MDFQLSDALPLLQRTPSVLRSLLGGLPAAWASANEGPNTWNPYDVVGHLIHGERADWIPRIEHILNLGESEAFKPFDREAMFHESRNKSLAQLLDEFDAERTTSLARLAELQISGADLDRIGRHPKFGVVTMRQLLSTWVAHDLTHISQIVRVMAVQYSEAVGPWAEFLSVLKSKP